MARYDRFAVVNPRTGEISERRRVPHQLEGRGYTMQSHGAEVPLYALGLSGAEWAVLDWLREHGAASAPVGVDNTLVAEGIGKSPCTVKTSLARLVRLGLVLRTRPRSSTYELNPRRYWEGSGAAQLQRLRRAEPPAVRPDTETRPPRGEGVAERRAG